MPFNHQTASADYKLSVNEEKNTSFRNFIFHFNQDKSICVDTIKDMRDGRIYIPAANFYNDKSGIDSILSPSAHQVFDNMLLANNHLKNKYLDFYAGLQNLTNQPIDSETVSKQAKQITKLEHKTSLVIYNFLNDLADDQFKTGGNDTIIVTMHKQDLQKLAKKILKTWDKNDLIVAILAETNKDSVIKTRTDWRKLEKDILTHLDNIVADKKQTLSAKITLTPDGTFGVKKLRVQTTYKNKTTNDHLQMDFKMQMSAYQKGPEIPKQSDIITKKEFDKVVSDGIKTYIQK